MRMKLVSRVLPARFGPLRTVAADEPALPDPTENVNRVSLSGTIVEEPQRDAGRDGEPITVLLISFTAHDKQARQGSACCEIEIPDPLADQHRDQLRIGGHIGVVGELTGARGLWATSIITQQPRWQRVR